MSKTEGPIVVAVGGGKGGVGKSVVSANLSVALAHLGFRVALVDADLGAANLHTMFGIDRPGVTLQGLVEKRITSLEEAMVATNVPRVFLVPGSGAIAGAANVAHAQKQKLMRHFRTLDADVIVLDCGAGVSFNVLDFFALADVRLVCATPQLTSLQNAYGFLKGAVFREMQSRASTQREKDLFAASSTRTETERVRGLLDRVAADDPELAVELANVVESFGAALVGNQLEAPAQVNVLHALRRMTHDFLDVDAPVWATLPRSGRVHASVTKRVPFVALDATSSEARAMLALAERVMTTDVAALRARRQQSRDDLNRAFAPVAGARGTDHDDESLPGPLGRYLRRHDRHRVDWPAEVHIAERKHDARVVDVSEGGVALVSVTAPVANGDVIAIAFVAEPDAPTVDAKVRYAGDDGRIGVQLLGEAGQRVAERLVKRARTAGVEPPSPHAHAAL